MGLLLIGVGTFPALLGRLPQSGGWMETVKRGMGLLLVAGLGLDYALFLSRSEAAAERKATNIGVLACVASTTIAFMILAASSIPVLKFLGLTVATGSLVSFAVAWAGSRRLSRRVS